jgi:hypothetical protein
LLREGRDEAAQSERATFVCLVSWLARSEDRERKRIARAMTSQAKHVQETQPPAERRALTPAAIARTCARLDELSARWRELEIGQSIAVEWPHRS